VAETFDVSYERFSQVRGIFQTFFTQAPALKGRIVMKIITILGSPRKKGNTAKVLSMFEDNVEKNHEVERINITQYKVGGCHWW